MPQLDLLKKRHAPPIHIPTIAAYILGVQKDTGEIPWSENGKTDPWDHVESAMGLTVGGQLDAAKGAYLWSRETQMPDGSWWSEYLNTRPLPEAHKDANMSAYIAVGVLHYYLATGDHAFLHTMWQTVERAMTFVSSLQGAEGQIYWAQRADGSTSQRALLTGNSSMYQSFRCAAIIARILGRARPEWENRAMTLRHAICHKPHLFDPSKSRYAMDWYYPILSGAFCGGCARARLKQSWKKFVIDGWGVRCVCDEAWVTMAETAELVMALMTLEEYETAETLFQWICANQYDNGAFWTGVTVPKRHIYTQEQTTWTGGAVLLAADMLYNLTPAWRLFRHHKKGLGAEDLI